MKYLLKRCICNNPELYLRKRLLHKGYELLKMDRYKLAIKHIVYTNSLTQTSSYIRNEYNLDIKL